MTQAPGGKKPRRPLRTEDLRGVAQLATQASHSAARLVEDLHRSVRSRLGEPGGGAEYELSGASAALYRGAHSLVDWIGKGADLALVKLDDLWESEKEPATDSAQRKAAISALNGLLGDRLAEQQNPLAIRMELQLGGQALNWHAMPQGQAVSDRVLILLHGFCLGPQQWRSGTALGLGQTLAQACGYTPVYLNYNTGLHISDNGRELDRQLQLLAQYWPVPLQEISLLGHDMGGLVARSTLESARNAPSRADNWLKQAKSVVFLGTPHHGAALQQTAGWLRAQLGTNSLTRGLSRLLSGRSAGLTDLYFALLQEADWHNAASRDADTAPAHFPLPQGISGYAIAASLSPGPSKLSQRLQGDGVVSVQSALGQHEDPQRCLLPDPDSRWVSYRTNHLSLLHRGSVAEQVVRWLSQAGAGAATGSDSGSVASP
jgi:pimeloyl-ACP methyl ester carboxylesterase